MTYIFILYYFFGSLKMTKTCISQRGLGHKVSHGFQRVVNLNHFIWECIVSIV